MANLTKTQIKKRIGELLDKMIDLKYELENLYDEVEEEINNIEPYEGKDDLTPQQEERQQWLEDTNYTIDSAKLELEESISSLKEVE